MNSLWPPPDGLGRELRAGERAGAADAALASGDSPGAVPAGPNSSSGGDGFGADAGRLLVRLGEQHQLVHPLQRLRRAGGRGTHPQAG